MRIVLLASALLALSAGAAAAQDMCAGGHPVVIRVSKLKPGGAATFAKATVDQRAWYRAHGITTNEQYVGAVLTPTGPSADQMVTLHMDAPLKRPDADAAWNAFVAEFRDSSDIVSETRACLRTPK